MNTIASEMLQDVLDSPEDDVPRLLMADYLEDHASLDQANFIRIQIQKVRDPLFHDSLCLKENRCRNCQREQELLKTYGSWIGEPFYDQIPCAGMSFQVEPYPTLSEKYETPEGYVGGTFSRGFLSVLDVEEDVLLEWGREIVKVQPIEEITLYDKLPWPTYLEPGQYSHVRQNQAPHWTKRSPYVKFVTQVLHEDLFNLLIGGELRTLIIPRGNDEGKDFNCRDYKNEQEPIDDLKQACLRYCYGA